MYSRRQKTAAAKTFSLPQFVSILVIQKRRFSTVLSGFLVFWTGGGCTGLLGCAGAAATHVVLPASRA
jgi:hypothetical protein